MKIDRVLVLADESANWEIAGLRQLERLLLALDRFAESIDSKIDIFVFWKPTLPEQHWLPEHLRLKKCEVNLGFVQEQVGRVLSTRLLLKPGALAGSLFIAPQMPEDDWEKLNEVFADACRNAERTADSDSWRYLTTAKDIPAAERWFLRGSGKSQDGFVARFLNRPISRAISRVLLKTSLTPGAWTLSIFALPIAGFILLLRGDYFGFVSGAALFQLFSILDGCDGEIARAKYLESERGRRLDTLGDVAGNILFALGLGLGLQRAHGFFYAGEGIVCASLIAANEWLLMSLQSRDAIVGVLGDTLYARHQTMIQRAGLLSLGHKPLWWLFQLTKRDVAILFFFLLAIAGRPQWILHFWTATSAVSLSLAISARSRAR
ncbi:MAG: CDP-alcohol phosphatidyltransferase family protein [Chthoniobacterales bacterium]